MVLVCASMLLAPSRILLTSCSLRSWRAGPIADIASRKALAILAGGSSISSSAAVSAVTSAKRDASGSAAPPGSKAKLRGTSGAAWAALGVAGPLALHSPPASSWLSTTLSGVSLSRAAAAPSAAVAALGESAIQAGGAARGCCTPGSSCVRLDGKIGSCCGEAGSLPPASSTMSAAFLNFRPVVPAANAAMVVG